MAMEYRRYQLAYSPTNDADIIQWLEAQDNVNDAIRQLIRGTSPRQDFINDLRAILREELANLTITGETASADGDIDPDAGDLLDTMF